MEEKMLDYDEIERLAKIVRPDANDMDSIYSLYKKYVDKNAIPPSYSGCTTCGNSIVKYWRNLMDWWSINKKYFVVE